MPGPGWLDGRLCYGGDYNPEQWPQDLWAEDIALMRRAGVTLVSVGVFAWSRLEPSEGEYDFGWLDRILDRLAEAAVGVALATPTAAPPPWFGFAHPEALPVTRDGVRLSHGSRDTYCASAPAYREAGRRIAAELGRRYAGHPALALWHVHNEYGTTCHCDVVAASFRRWLQERYQSLEHLNEAWTGAFWSQLYTDWEHILPPRATQYLGNPSQLLDFRRFCSDELLACFREQRDVLRALTPDVPVTTNFVLGSWVPVDHRRWASEVDLVAIDHYPSSAEPFRAEHETAFAADLARGWARGERWLLMEQAPNLTYAGGRMLPKPAGQLARLSLSHVARGSRGAMFFQWRAPRGGAEMFHSAIVGHAGADTRVFAEVAEFGALLNRIGAAGAATGSVDANVAVLWDADSGWALQGPGLPSPDIDYVAAVRDVHGALWRAGITADVIGADADLTPYRLVAVPAMFVLRADTAEALRSYTQNGGCLAVWFLSGVVDETHRAWPGGYPGPLRDVVGVRVEEWHPVDGEVALSGGGTGRAWTELVRTAGAAAEVTYASGPLAGQPAITRHRLGDGTAWYVSTQLDDVSLDRFLPSLLSDAGLPPGSTVGVELVRRRSPSGRWLFAINHSTHDVQVLTRGVDLVASHVVDGTLRLPAGAFAVLDESDDVDALAGGKRLPYPAHRPA